MHAAGFDRRKNVVNLVSAYARLPAPLRAVHQLVLVGSIDAAQLGFERDQLVAQQNAARSRGNEVRQQIAVIEAQQQERH